MNIKTTRMPHLTNALNRFMPMNVTYCFNDKGNLAIINEYLDPNEFVKLEGNQITFTIQSGTIPENGINGIQASDLLRFNLELIKSLNESFPCRENSLTITKLEEAIQHQEARTVNRIFRNVEGKNEV